MNTLVGVDHRNTIKPKSVKSIKSVKSGSDRERGKKFCWDKDNSGLLSEKEFKRNLPKLKNIFKKLQVIESFHKKKNKGKNKKYKGQVIESFYKNKIPEKISHVPGRETIPGIQVGGISPPTCVGSREVNVTDLVEQKMATWNPLIWRNPEKWAGLTQQSGAIHSLIHSFHNLQIYCVGQKWNQIVLSERTDTSEEAFYAFTTEAYKRYLEFVLNYLCEDQGRGYELEHALEHLHVDFYTFPIRRAEGENVMRHYYPLCDYANIIRNTYLAFSNPRTANIPQHDRKRAIMWRGWAGDLPPDVIEALDFTKSLTEHLPAWEDFLVDDHLTRDSYNRFNLEEDYSDIYARLPVWRPMCCNSWTVNLGVAVDFMTNYGVNPRTEEPLNLFMVNKIDPQTSAIIASISDVPGEKEVLVNFFVKYKILLVKELSSVTDITEFVTHTLNDFTNGILMRREDTNELIERVEREFQGGESFQELFVRMLQYAPNIRIIIVDIIAATNEEVPEPLRELRLPGDPQVGGRKRTIRKSKRTKRTKRKKRKKRKKRTRRTKRKKKN